MSKWLAKSDNGMENKMSLKYLACALRCCLLREVMAGSYATPKLVFVATYYPHGYGFSHYHSLHALPILKEKKYTNDK